MSEKVLPLLNAVYNALNGVTVHGRQNLENLAGSLKILEDVMNMIAKESEEKPPKKE